MQAGYRQVTVAQLLSHTSGMPYAPSKEESHERFRDLSEAMKNRYQYVKNAVADKPQAKPGEKHIYSGGQVIVAHHAERLTKKPVEELYEEYVYRKLEWLGRDHVNVTSALDRVDGPWPHALEGDKVVARAPLGEYGKSRLPVGGVCCNMIDLGKVAAGHLRGAQGKDGLLKAETYKKLHADQPGWGTMSWFPSGVDWAKGPCFWHNGATGDWFCLVHILPDENYATCVATNYGGKGCDQACQTAHLELVKRIPRLKDKLPSTRGPRR
jgi:CubicO group peptidase (beta-lactamase class C family)